MASLNLVEKKRLVSLDTFRGLTIAGMIIVNTPGSWEFVFPPLLHASWNGLTLTDLVFPFFLFIVGVSIVLAYTRKIQKVSLSSLIKDLVRRSITLFVLGVLLNLIAYRFQELRLPGILQRISITFLSGALLFLYTSKRTQIIVCSAILLLYWVAMKWIPVPEYGAGVLEPGKNLANYIDSVVIPYKMFHGTWDPEGLFTSLPSIASTLMGMFTGYIVLSKRKDETKLVHIFVFGVLLCSTGAVVGWFFPINKNLWSPSFVLYTSGLANLTFATIYFFMDIKGYVSWARFGIIFGTNAIAAYVIHYLFTLPVSWIKFGNLNLQQFYMKSMIDLQVMPEMASFVWALLYTALCFIPVWILYRKKIFLKI
jgi:predicted acyltransferase